MITGREMLIYLSLKYEGDWQKIYQAIFAKEPIDHDEVSKSVASLTCQVVTMVDPDYPKQLLHMTNAPFVLYFYGDLSLISSPDSLLAIIGCRENSDYGKAMTEKITSGVAKKVTVISGMAKGIDTIALKSAIAHDGKVVAVLGSGIDYCYPVRNKDLFDQVKKGHLVISEYPQLTPPRPQNFIDRNRIIAALSHAIVVTEAKYRSGTLSTVTYGLQYGKDIMCVPHRANEQSLCNRLLKEGASLVENGEDVLDEFKHFIP